VKAGERLAQRFLQLDAAAEGGMGTIFRASDELSGEEVALKVMSGVAGGSGQERFAREAAIPSW
jgi:serine/threonine protein kinase